MAKVNTARGNSPIRVLMVDDHHILLDTLSRQLQEDVAFEVAGIANSIESAESVVARKEVDVVLLDIELGEESGLDAITRLREMREELRIVVLSMFSHQVYRERAFELGVDAYVTKGVAFSVLRDFLIDNEISEDAGGSDMIWHSRQGMHSAHMALSERELQVLRALSQGMRHKEVADLLDISISSVGTYLCRAMRKTDFESCAELLRYASSLGVKTSS
jgi:DNA-binding NarL/FixJ family response regulator